MKYRILARFIRAFLTIGILIISISMTLNVCSELFHIKKHLRIGNFTLGDTTPGFKMQMGLNMSIPDTIVTFKGNKKGTLRIFNTSIYGNAQAYNSSEVASKITQKFVVDIPGDPISVYNNIRSYNAVEVNVDTSNKTYKAFWTISRTVKLLCLIFIFIFIIKLVNIYLEGNFLRSKSFKLISYVGILLIFIEVFEIICVFINAKIIPVISLETRGVKDKFVDNNLQLNLNFGDSVSYSYIGIGMMVVILSKVIKDAVAIKHENDLTI